MAADRMRRVNGALREVLSGRIARGLKDPRVGFVTVTAVDTSPDLSHARVYVSVLGGESERADALAGLESSRGYLQAAIAAELRLKRTPALRFEPDAALERGERVARLLDEIEAEHVPPAQAPPAEGEPGAGEPGDDAAEGDADRSGEEPPR